MIDSISAQGTTVTRTESIKEERKALYSILLRIGGQTKFLKLQKNTTDRKFILSRILP
jgi:hypothetical protein